MSPAFIIYTMRKLSDYIMVAVKGLLMGAANVIPGVSGGTIAFLTGIYTELLESIKSVDGTAVKLLLTGRFGQFWKKINGNFLLAVGVGILVSIFSLAKLMTFLLETYPIQTWAFFFGLVLVSTIYMIKDLKDIRWQQILSALVGVVCGVTLCLVSPSETGESLPFIFICGAIGMCTMILPGISGSFVLVLLGKYAYIMDAVSNLDILVLAVFAVGAVVGILAFSHFFSWVVKKAYNGTIMFLSGLMLGSLVKVWPWKRLLDSGVDRPVLPSQYTGDPALGGAVIWAVAGILLVLVIETMSARRRSAGAEAA